MPASDLRNTPHRLRIRDTRNAALSCEEAFRDSAFTRYLFPDAGPSDRGVIAMFEFIVRYASIYGEAHAPTSDIEGVACWYREDGLSASLWRVLRAGGLLVTVRDRDAWRRLIRVEPYLSQTRRRWMQGPYLYLDLFAVRPGLQGQGYGATLLRHLTSRADALGLPCCVETFKEDNVAMYRHFGFGVSEVLTDTPIGEPVYFMVREPQVTHTHSARP